MNGDTSTDHHYVIAAPRSYSSDVEGVSISGPTTREEYEACRRWIEERSQG